MDINLHFNRYKNLNFKNFTYVLPVPLRSYCFQDIANYYVLSYNEDFYLVQFGIRCLLYSSTPSECCDVTFPRRLRQAYWTTGRSRLMNGVETSLRGVNQQLINLFILATKCLGIHSHVTNIRIQS